MPSATISNASTHIPAWKRLGLQLKSAQEPPVPAVEPPKDAETSKRKRTAPTESSTPSKKSKKRRSPSDSHPQDPVTPQLVRKKSVAFTPETKIEDGDSIKQLFDTWVAEQKSQDPSFELRNSNPAFKTPEAPRVEEEVNAALDEKERRVKRVKKLQQENPKSTPKPKRSLKVARPLTPSSRPFLQYLKQYHESRESWKFNKNHQNHLLKHIFNVAIVPSDHAYLIYEYVKGLQGGVRTRLRDTALAVKVKDSEDGATGFPEEMSNPEKRQREYEAAMTEYVATMTAAQAPDEIGYEEGVLLGLSDKAMESRVAKRMRAEKILALLASYPEGNGKTGSGVVEGDTDTQKRLRMNDGTSQKLARKRKQRTAVADDDSDSDDNSSNSSDSSSDDSAAQNEQDDTSSSSSSSSSGSDSEEDDSEGDSEEDSEESDSE